MSFSKVAYSILTLDCGGSGVAPPSFVAIQAGQTLQQLTTMSGAWSWTSVSWLAVFSILSMLPVFLRDRLRTKFD